MGFEIDDQIHIPPKCKIKPDRNVISHFSDWQKSKRLTAVLLTGRAETGSASCLADGHAP